jgi:hypothetical protein
VLFYHVKHSRINPPSVPVEFKQRIHRLLIILIISGDILVSVKFSKISLSSSLPFSSLSVDGIDPSKKESEN